MATENQLNLPLIYFIIAVLLSILCWSMGYLVMEKSLASGIRFEALFGLAMSISAGFATYIHMPIHLKLARG